MNKSCPLLPGARNNVTAEELMFTAEVLQGYCRLHRDEKVEVRTAVTQVMNPPMMRAVALHPL